MEDHLCILMAHLIRYKSRISTCRQHPARVCMAQLIGAPAANNDFGKLIGKVAVLRMAFGCPDAVPALSEWKRLGAMTTKGIDYSMNTINSEADDAKGLVENLVNNMDLTISGEGEFRKSDKDNEIGAWRLSKYIFDEVQAGRQPNLWVRFDFAGENAGTYIQGYMNTTSWSGDFGTNDISTFSGEWKVYDADSSIDLYGLYSIAESLPDERLGYFDYTFDDENDSLGDRVQAICNAASVVAYWDDGVLTFTRDQKVDYPAAVFNRANMKTDEYKMTYEATLPGGYDGVQVSYVHPTTNNKTYINYRVLNGAIVEQEAENPNKLEIVGFRNEYQARERALRETKRLIYSRVKMNAKVFEDGIIQVGSVIQMPDIYDSNQQQGYITGRSGNNFDTSEPITFAGSMYVLVTDSLGNPTLRYPATTRADTKYGFTSAIPNIQLNIWNGDTVQLPSRYLIATVEELDSQLWKVSSIKPNTDNTVSLTVAEYSDAIYQ